MRRSKCWSVGVYVVAGACLAATIMATSGCDEKASKKGELSETEIKRLTLAQKPERPDQVIVCGETITWEDVLSAMPEDTGGSLKDRLDKAAQDMLPRQFMEDERPAVQQRLNNKISSIVLSKRAERDLGKKDKFDEKLNELAETELRRFIYDEHGGNGAEADEALRKLGMNRTTYKQWKKKELLARYLVESKYSRNRPITYSELQERYEEMKKAGKFVLEAVLQWRLIDVSVDKMGAKYPNEDASLKARQLAEDLRRRIDAGADFAELARSTRTDREVKRAACGRRATRMPWPPRTMCWRNGRRR
jgi:hypothetical protein